MNKAINPDEYGDVLVSLKTSLYNDLLVAEPDLLSQADSVIPLQHVLTPFELKQFEQLAKGDRGAVENGQEISDLLPKAEKELTLLAEAKEKANEGRKDLIARMEARLTEIRQGRKSLAVASGKSPERN